MSDTIDSQLKPPLGSEKHAHEYLGQLINLLNTDKLIARRTDLARFDPSNLQKHYRIDLNDYLIEVSHAKNPDSGNDSFVLVFTNLKRLQDNCDEKVILGYLHLVADQFRQIERAITTQELRIKRREEEAAFTKNMQPLDTMLKGISSTIKETVTEQSTPEPPEQQTLSSMAQSKPPAAYS